MRKFEKFFLEIADVRSYFRGPKTKLAKYTVGDAIHNNRTLTVNQTIRLLKLERKTKLAKQLEATYKVIGPAVIVQRRRRTDAVDLNEFVTVYRRLVMNNKILRRTVANTLRKVG